MILNTRRQVRLKFIIKLQLKKFVDLHQSTEFTGKRKHQAIKRKHKNEKATTSLCQILREHNLKNCAESALQ